MELARVKKSEHILFPLTVIEVGAAHVASSKPDTSFLWHERFGHTTFNSLQQLARKKLVHGLLDNITTHPCEDCAYGKQIKLPFPEESMRRATKPLELIHGDLSGPMQTKSRGGNSYFMLLGDDYTKFAWVYYL